MAAPSRKPRNRTPEISVVVPVLNEEGNITPLVTSICEIYGKRPIEIIYVDDGSTDGTAAELAGLKAEIPALRVLTHSQRSGQSAALRTGILAASAPLIATLDGDGQNPPHDLIALEEAVHENRPGLVMAAGVRVNRRDGWRNAMRRSLPARCAVSCCVTITPIPAVPPRFSTVNFTCCCPILITCTASWHRSPAVKVPPCWPCR